MTISTKLNRKKILKELDKYWSLLVRNRDRKCMLCGGFIEQIDKLQAHHWILSRAKSLKYRYDVRNGISLCYGCHIHQVHTNPTVDIINRLMASAVQNRIVSQDEISEISSTGREVSKISTVELFELLEKLKADYNNLPKSEAVRAKPLLSRVNKILVND